MKRVFFKTIIFHSLLLGITLNTYAQVKIGSSFRAAVPFGQFKEFGSIGFGSAPTMKIFITDNFALSGNIGWISTILNTKPNVKNQYFFNFPINAGPQFYFFKNGFRPFVGFNAGAYINHYRFVTTFNGHNDKHRITNAYFGIAPEAGFLIGLSEHLDININCKYNIQYVPANTDLNVNNTKTTFEFIEVQLGLLYTIGGKDYKEKQEKKKEEKKKAKEEKKKMKEEKKKK